MDAGTPICRLADRERWLLEYVGGTISAKDAETFEVHCMTCDECAAELERGVEIHAAGSLAPARSAVGSALGSVEWRWLAAAASVVLVISLWRLASGPAPAPEPSAAAPAVTAVTPAPAVRPSAPAQAPSTPPPTAPAVPIVVLARVDPPIYVPVALRNARDEAAERFDAAMRRYADKDFAGAIPDLEAAVRLRPDAPHANFFLAICRLLASDVGAAVEGLRRTIALGESAYLEEAHFYLAKARLRQNNLMAARDELTRTVERRGPLQTEAQQLLVQVDRLLLRKSGR